MNKAFIYLLIFSSVVLMIYYVVIIYFDVMKKEKDGEKNDIFIPDGEDDTYESKEVNKDGIVISEEEEEEQNLSEGGLVIGYGDDSCEDSVDEPAPELSEEHGTVLQQGNEDSPSDHYQDAIINEHSEERDGENIGVPESGSSSENEGLSDNDKKENAYWEDPFYSAPSEQYVETGKNEPTQTEEPSPQDLQEGEGVKLYDSSNVNIGEKDQEECIEVNESLEEAFPYYPGELSIEEMEDFAQRMLQENAPGDGDSNIKRYQGFPERV